jgi:hypothetical protein
MAVTSESSMCHEKRRMVNESMCNKVKKQATYLQGDSILFQGGIGQTVRNSFCY